jgi:hypothetical protein
LTFNSYAILYRPGSRYIELYLKSIAYFELREINAIFAVETISEKHKSNP